MTIQGIAACHRILRAVWPAEAITEDTVRAWQWAFEDQRDEDVAAAVKLHIRQSKWFPKPAELLELIAEQTVAAGLLPEEAWLEVLREVSRVGLRRGDERRFSDPLIAEAVSAVGWGLICTADAAEARKQFVFTLRAVIGRARRARQHGAAGLALAGAAEPVEPLLPERVA